MGLYYTLKNGEQIEINIEVDEEYNKTIYIKLFGGSMVYEYDYYKESYNLNEIIEDIENRYNDLLLENSDFEYKCWAD